MLFFFFFNLLAKDTSVFFSFLSSWRVTHIWETLEMSLHTEHQNRNIRKEIKRKRARNSVCVSSLKAEWLVAGARLWWKREALCEGAVRFSIRPSVATDTLLFPLVPRSSEQPPKFNNGDQMTNELLNKHFYRTQDYLSMNYDNFGKCREDCLDVMTPFTVLVYIELWWRKVIRHLIVHAHFAFKFNKSDSK